MSDENAGRLRKRLIAAGIIKPSPQVFLPFERPEMLPEQIAALKARLIKAQVVIPKFVRPRWTPRPQQNPRTPH